MNALSRTSPHAFEALATFLIRMVLIGPSITSVHAATYSDDNWTSMGGISGVDGEVYAAAVDASGNLYVGGAFTIAGEVFANKKE